MPSPFLHPFAKPTYDGFIRIVRGSGAVVFDDQGNEYVDALGSLWYCNIGHGRREMADAIRRQVERLEAFHTFEIFTNDPADRLAQTLADLSPMPDSRVFFTDSGSEAVDTAIKLARLRHFLAGRPEKHLIVARRHAYHGVTYGGMSVQGLPPNQEGFGPLLPEVHHVAHDDLSEAQALFAERGDDIAAVIAEPVIGAGGVYPPEPGYLEGLRRLCDEHDALLVLDEVITAFGRLGTWSAASHYGIRPDLVTFAKGVTSGYQPLGGVLVGAEVREALEADPAFVLRHGFTYSGHPTTCAAASTNLEIIRREGLLDRAKPIGEQLRAGLTALRDEGLLAEVRGDGAVWAAGMPPDVSAPDVRTGMLERGVIARPIATHTIAFCPPLVIDEAAIDACIDALRDSLRAVRGAAVASPRRSTEGGPTRPSSRRVR
jgi:adenosylmethionine-8-amino-7-oxononanoate aminotransferase